MDSDSFTKTIFSTIDKFFSEGTPSSKPETAEDVNKSSEGSDMQLRAIVASTTIAAGYLAAYLIMGGNSIDHQYLVKSAIRRGLMNSLLSIIK